MPADVEVLLQYASNVSRLEFPFINTEHDYRAIYVVRRGRPGDDSWAIVDEPFCYQPKGRRWAYERRPSSRTNKFLKASRMPLEQALPLAEKLSARMARKWEKRLARMIARQEAMSRQRSEEAANGRSTD